MQTWKEKAIELYISGTPKRTIARRLFKEIGAPNLEAARTRVRNLLHDYEIAGYDGDEDAPHEVLQNLVPERHAQVWDGCKTIRFGLMGDTQINSKYTQLTHLHAFYDKCQQLGISTVFHTGDIDDGEQMRPGHQYECYTQGADDHADEIAAVYPKRDGITTYFITGNHDASLYKRAGMDIGKAIASRRPDMVYLGRDCAVVELTPNCTLELRHPWDGTAYALSYKPQKIVEAMDPDTKPNILAIGHYHKLEYIFHRNVHVFQTGCYQSQTPFTRGKGISVATGGWIIECDVGSDGTVRSVTPRIVPVYSCIPDDYKSPQFEALRRSYQNAQHAQNIIYG